MSAFEMEAPIVFAWLNPDPEYEQICPEIGFEATICEQHPRDLGWIPLYAQQEWVGLTDEELHDLQIEHLDDPWANFKAIEQALREKNT
jgi:hypothetical protein